jgi:tRNA nucleotidyltransferase (CCA-adding enzyme)
VLSQGARRVLDLLDGVGQTLVVGGAVRDALLAETARSAPSSGGDVDMEVRGVPDVDAVMAALRDAGAVVVRAGARFEVLKVVLDDAHVDVAVLPGGSDLEADFAASAARRDFTVNAVAWDPRSDHLLDAVGGIDDAAAGVLRHVSERFAEDPLRVLRAVQLVSRFGLAVHPDTVALARSLSPEYGSIARERVWPELRKVVQGDHVSAALDLLYATDWERHLPELAAVRDVPQDPHWHPEGPVHVHSGLAGDVAARACTADGVTGEDRVVIVLAAVLHDLGKAGDGTWTTVADDGTVRLRSLGHEVSGAAAARSLLRRVGAPRSVVDRVTVIIREHMVVHSTDGAPSVPAARRLLRRLGGSLATAEAWARVCDADARGRGAGASTSPAWVWLEVLRSAGVAGSRARLVTGRDLIEAGMVPGPDFRALLDEAADAQDDGRFEDVAGAGRWLSDRVRAREPRS